jgi:hypothetical protein
MLAHASGFGWDEALMVLAPIALVGALLNWARRRDGRIAATRPLMDPPQ